MKNLSKFKLLTLLFLTIALSCSSDSEDNTPPPEDETPSPIQVVTYATLVNAKDALAIDVSGNLYASNYFQDYVRKIGTDQSVSTFLNNQDGAAGMVFDSDGSMFLARYESSDILKIPFDGSSSEIYATDITGPIALDFDSNGNLYTNNNTITRITKFGTDGNISNITSGFPNSSSLVLDNNDNIYISDYNSGVIKKIEAVTNTETIFTTLPVSNDGGIAYIIFADGYFYATSASDHVVFMIDANGSSSIITGTQELAGNVDGNGNDALLNGPIGIVASADGRTLYVAHSGKIVEITGFRED